MLTLSILLVLSSPSAVPAGDLVTEARGLFEQGSLDQAADLLLDALDRGEEDERELRLLLARVHVASGRADSAVETLHALSAREDYEVTLALGAAQVAWANQLMTMGARDDDIHMARLDARSNLEQAMLLAPADDTSAVVQLGNLTLYQLGDHGQALSLANDALKGNPQDGELMLLRGCAGVYEYWNAFQAGNEESAGSAWQRSVDDLLQAQRQLPDQRVEPAGQLTWLYEQNGYPMEAVEAAMTIVDRQEDPSFDRLYGLAKRYAYERQLEAAGKALEKIVSLSARDLTNRLRREQDPTAVATELAWAVDPFVQRNDSATARLVLAAITAANPENAVIWDNYAVFCQLTQRFEDALKAYERRLEIDGSDPRTYNDMAAVLQYDLKREVDRARDMYRKCIAMADGELARAGIAPDRRSHLEEARRVAQSNLDGTNPQRGVLDSVLQGLRNIKIPKLPGQQDEASEDGDAEQPAGEGTEG